MISIRHAQPQDHHAIGDFVRSERLRPTGLHWQRFTLALDSQGRIAGAIQIRHHRDGSRELGSFAVRPDLRGRGVGGGLVEHALVRNPGPVYLVTREQLIAYFQRWDFGRAGRHPLQLPDGADGPCGELVARERAALPRDPRPVGLIPGPGAALRINSFSSSTQYRHLPQ